MVFKSIIHISLTALLVFSILTPSFVELISDIEIVEIADINDKEKKEKLEKDIVEILEDFSEKAKSRNICIKLISEKGTVDNPKSYIKFFNLNPKAA